MGYISIRRCFIMAKLAEKYEAIIVFSVVILKRVNLLKIRLVNR